MNPEMLKALGARIRICADIVGNGDELARRTGIPRRTLETYLAGTAEPKTFRLAAIGKAAGVRLEWLATGEGPKLLDGEEPHAQACADSVWEAFDLVPLYEVMVSAGPGVVVEGERIDAQLAFRKDWLRRLGLQTRQLALVRADGDSMQPTINDGDALLIDTSKRHLTDGHIYVMRINDELRAKRLQRLVDGSVRVSSDNAIYTDEVIDASDLDQLHILGRVVWKGGLI